MFVYVVETQNICVVYTVIHIFRNIFYLLDYTLWIHRQHIPTSFLINRIKGGSGAWVMPIVWLVMRFKKWMHGKFLTKFHPSSRNIYWHTTNQQGKNHYFNCWHVHNFQEDQWSSPIYIYELNVQLTITMFMVFIVTCFIVSPYFETYCILG